MKAVMRAGMRFKHALLDHEVGNHEVDKAKDWLVLEVSNTGALKGEVVGLLEV